MILAAKIDIRERTTRPRASFYVVLWLLFAGLLLAGCGKPQPETFVYSGPIMGTTYNVKVVALNSEIPTGLDREIHQVLVDIDRAMSTYKPDSELNQLNQAAVGVQFAVSPALMEVLSLSQNVYKQTGGAFDPTVGPLVDLWGFGPSSHENAIPEIAEIRKFLSEVGFDAVILDVEKKLVTKTKPLALDLSAVAKGYATDRVGEVLRHHRLENYMVEVGGEMVLSGHNDRGVSWQIAIEKPDSTSRSVQQIVITSVYSDVVCEYCPFSNR